MNIPHSYQLYTSEQSRNLDARTISEFGIDGFTLMEIAGTRAADFIMENISSNAHGLICCGKGNNAGDALVVARILAEHGFEISLLFALGVDDLSTDCQKNYDLLRKTGHSFNWFTSFEELPTNTFDFVVDGLLGTGLNSELRSPIKETVAWINEHSPLTFAMDIPTGLSADSGEEMGLAVQTDFTLTFGVLKHGFFLADGYERCGEIILCDLPFPTKFRASSRFLIDKLWVEQQEACSTKKAHKYDGGVVYLIAGSEGLTGAAVLAAKSAWSTGVGAVVLITPHGLLTVYEKQLPQIIKKPVGKSGDSFFKPVHVDAVQSIMAEKPGVLLIGPGLGRNTETMEFVHKILGSFEGQVVIDADALFALDSSTISKKPAGANWMLTPHPGELSTLLGKKFKSENERLDFVQEFAQSHRITVLSKGLPSAVATPHSQLYITGYDTRIFSRAGFGDVLAGKTAGFLLQKKSEELAACFALIDGKTKADHVLSSSTKTLEPLDII